MVVGAGFGAVVGVGLGALVVGVGFGAVVGVGFGAFVVGVGFGAVVGVGFGAFVVGCEVVVNCPRRRGVDVVGDAVVALPGVFTVRVGDPAEGRSRLLCGATGPGGDAAVTAVGAEDVTVPVSGVVTTTIGGSLPASRVVSGTESSVVIARVGDCTHDSSDTTA